MAIIENCAIDWSFDLFAKDMESVHPLPLRRGVRSSGRLSKRQQFCQWLKTEAKAFAEENSDNGIYLTGCTEYIGDEFAKRLNEMNFSEFYKDMYNQRPHFNEAFVSMLCGLPVFYEIGFCDGGMNRCLKVEIETAKKCRTLLGGN